MNVTKALAFASGLVFTANDILTWQDHSFASLSHYQVIEEGNLTILDAQCSPGKASALFYRQGINLEKTPWIKWQWRVLKAPSGAPENTKNGDDFALRVYAIDEHSIFRWRTRAINYVWARDTEAQTQWPNPFAEQAQMLALQSGVPERNNNSMVDSNAGWKTEVRNIQEDFADIHERDLQTLSALAIMTDCDNTQSSAHGQLLEISFHAEKPSTNN